LDETAACDEAVGSLVALRFDSAKLLLRMFIFSGAIIVLGILISGATNCRNRWLQPLVIPAPILVAAFCQELLSRRQLKIIVGLASAVAVGVVIAAPGRILLSERLGRQESLNVPFKNFARRLKDPLAQSTVLYCNDNWVACNLRIWFPGKLITSPVVSKLYSPARGCALVWDPSIGRPAAFLSGAAPLAGSSPAEAVYFEERLKYHCAQTMRLGALLPR